MYQLFLFLCLYLTKKCNFIKKRYTIKFKYRIVANPRRMKSLTILSTPFYYNSISASLYIDPYNNAARKPTFPSGLVGFLDI